MEADERTNYQMAKEEADKIDAQIIAILQQGKNFRVEAGAGSGKTYSLNKVIEWIQDNKWNEYRRKNQNVVCITYTNAAVNVIAERLANDSFILPSTIHSFAWNAIKQYQSFLLRIIKENENLQPREGDFSAITQVQYTLGHRYKQNGILYLFHDDVITLFSALLDNVKFRRMFSDRFPLILIDEYQDSFRPIMDKFIEYFIDKDVGPQFGFFGDAWQTIYQSNKACGLIEHENITEIKKVSNFRSASRIVDLLNDIRPQLPQISAIDDFEGEVLVITCDDYIGERRTDRNFKGDLPANVLKSRLTNLTEHIKKNHISDKESLKILMITHKVLAFQQGYEKLLDILDNGLRDKEDIFLQFFMEMVEPIFKALETSDMQLLFDTLKVKRYPITKKYEKVKWRMLQEQLTHVRAKKTIDVLKVVIESELIPIPQNISAYYGMYYSVPDLCYSNTTIKEFLDLEYEQFLSVINFLYPEAEFSTEHGVKGEEYDNVVFVISKGWNQYQFETYAPMIKNGYDLNKEASYVRNRNLFYVCCSRPKKRLFFFVSVEINDTFRDFLSGLVGEDNIFTYEEYIGRDWREG
ncbi:MAG: AAA family ATPase [Clostridium sp.]|nr:AAA family ATPase [Clostridium sp.]